MLVRKRNFTKTQNYGILAKSRHFTKITVAVISVFP